MATIPLSDNPAEVAVTPDGKFAYVSLASTAAGGPGSTVAVISTASGSVIGNISVGEEPRGLAITPDGRFVYVANSSWNSVWVISTNTNNVVATIPVGSRPESVAVAPDGSLVYVANAISNNISVINVASNTVVNTISVGSGSASLAIAPDGASVYISNSVSGTVSIIDTSTNAVTGTVSTGSNSRGIAIAPDGKTAYVASGTAAAGFFVSAIDTATNAVTAQIPENAAGAPAEVAVSPDGGLVYVSDSAADSLILISTATNSVVNSIPMGATPGTVVFAPDGTGPLLVSVTFHPAAVSGGAPATGVVTLNAAAPSGGITDFLVSDNSAVAVPASVTVPAGSKIATFAVTTMAVSRATPVTITAAYRGFSKSGSLTIIPGADVSIASVSVDAVAVVGGVSATGRVLLTAPARAGGIEVELWTDGSPAFVPASVTVPAGSSMVAFPVTTIWTSVSQPDTITAFYQGEAKTTTIVVQPALSIASVIVPVTATGGTTVSGNVTLNAPAPPEGAVVSLWTSGFPAFVPLSVTIAAGSTNSAFTITTVQTSEAAEPVITAFYNGTSKTATMTVALSAGLNSVSATPKTIIAGSPATGTVTLNSAAPAGGLVVDLWTNGFPAFVPGSVTIPEGSTTATFPVTTVFTTTAAQSTITAFYSGVAKTTTLSIAPAPTLAAISAPGAVIGGTSLSGTVSLSAPAQAGGVVVNLWTSGFPAFVPASVTIAGGATTASFTIMTVPTSAPVQPVITAFYGDAIRTAVVNVAPTISHQATLSWNVSATPPPTYNVYRASNSGGPYLRINTAAITTTGYTDVSVIGGTTYYYVVTAVTSNGSESDYSNEAVAAIPSD